MGNNKLATAAKAAADYLDDQLEVGATFKNLNFMPGLEPHPRPVSRSEVVEALRSEIDMDIPVGPDTVVNPWKPIETFNGNDSDMVDLWLHIWASPRSMGMSDSFRRIDCWKKNGHWVDSDGPLYEPYITHWVSITEPEAN